MKILRSFFSGKYWLANSKGERLTPNYSYIKEHYYGPYYLIVCGDYSGYMGKARIVLVYSLATEEEVILGDIRGHKQVTEDVFALFYDGTWHLFNMQGDLIRADVQEFVKCEERDMYMATIQDKEYYLDTNFNTLSEGFADISDFDEYGYAVVEDDTTEEVLVINEAMKVILKVGKYDEIESMSKELFRVYKNEWQGVLDICGKEILPTIYQDIVMKGGNHFLLKYNGKYGLADITGNIIFECFYDEIMETPDKFVVKDFAKIEVAKTKEVKKK